MSLGPTPAEGEPTAGEGEFVDADAAREKLDVALATGDTDNDGRLSFAESVSAVPGLTPSVFDALDTNRDGQLSPDELGVKAGLGCAGCQGTKTKSVGDVFTVLLGLLGLAATAGVKRW